MVAQTPVVFDGGSGRSPEAAATTVPADAPRLHIGADTHRDGWLSCDIDASLKPDVHCDLATAPWPFAENSFGAVEMHEVIEHLPDHLAVLRELHRVTMPGGVVSVKGPHPLAAPTAWGHPDHCRPFDHRELSHGRASEWFDVETVIAHRRGLGRVLPNRLALAVADYVPNTVGAVQVIARVR